MVRDKTKLLKALKTADATTWQTKAAFILLRVNGIENALKYTNQVNRRNKKENPSIMQIQKIIKSKDEIFRKKWHNPLYEGGRDSRFDRYLTAILFIIVFGGLFFGAGWLAVCDYIEWLKKLGILK